MRIQDHIVTLAGATQDDGDNNIEFWSATVLLNRLRGKTLYILIVATSSCASEVNNANKLYG